jgi:Tectonin domain
MGEIKAGYDGTLYGLTSAGDLYTFTVAAGWVEAPSALQTAGGKSLTHISVGNASEVLALSSAASPANNVFVLNSGGTAWTALSRRLSAAEIGSDGSIWGLDSSGYVWCYINGVWSDHAGAGEVSNIAASSAHDAMGVSSSGGLMQWNGSAFAAFSPAPNFTPSQAKDAIAMVGDAFVAALDASGGIHVLINSPPTQPQAVAVGTVTCTYENRYLCTATVPSVAGIQVGDNISIAGNILGGGSLTVYSTTACSPAPCVEYIGANSGGPYSGGTLTDNTAGGVGSNWGKWSTIQGTASALTGGGAYTFALSGSGTYHLNLTIPTLTVTATSSHQCTRGGCLSETPTAQAYFTDPPGAHGSSGVTVSVTKWEPNTIELIAVEQNPYCDPINHNGGCSPYYDTCANCLGGCSGAIGITTQVEGALTQAYWNGTPVPSCSKLCSYSVHNNCTVATTPPDLNMIAVESGNYVGIATYISWINAAVCIRFFAPGPWACTPALSFINSLNVAMPPYPCTHNP